MADIEKTKATEAEKTEYAEPDMRPEKLIKQQEREAKMTPDELYAELKLALIRPLPPKRQPKSTRLSAWRARLIRHS